MIMMTMMLMTPTMRMMLMMSVMIIMRVQMMMWSLMITTKLNTLMILKITSMWRHLWTYL